MTEQPIGIPFSEPGFNEGADPYALQPGAMVLAQNVRWRKAGRFSRRYGLASVGTSVRTGSTAMTSAPIPQVITEFRGNRVVGTGGILYHSAPGLAWSEGDRIGQFTPRRIDAIARHELDGPVISPAAAYISGYQLVAWARGAGVGYTLSDDYGNVLLTGVRASGDQPRVIAVGSSFVLTYRDTTGTGRDIYGLRITPSTLSVSAATLIATTQNASDRYDAAPFDGSSTQFLFAYRNAATTSRATLVTASTFAIAAGQNSTHANAAVVLGIFGTSGENIYLAVVEETTPRLQVEAFNAALSASTGGPTTVDSNGYYDQPSFCRESATSVRLCWARNDPTFTRGWNVMQHCSVSSAAVLGAVQSHYNVRPASRPFDATATRFRCWVSTIRYLTTSIQFERYALVTFEADAGTYYGHIELVTEPGSATYENTGSAVNIFDLPAVVSGLDYSVPLEVALKRSSPGTTGLEVTTGIDLFRFYAATNARDAHRPAVEAAGALHIGGGVTIEHTGGSGSAQRLAGVENGFLHPPVIWTAALVAGGSLTSGATYQYCAVFEAIDPTTGRRHRSAPSNIVAVSPSGGNLSARIYFHTLGLSGRLLKSDQPVSVHIYRTLANGAQFQRVTSAILAPGGSGLVVGFDNHLDTLADTTVGDEEFLYVLGGVLQNDMAPSHRFSVRGGGRVWLGGLFRENFVGFSKVIVPGEPLQFVEADQFRLQLPEPVTGLGYMDGSLVIFTEQGVYLTSGDGPNDNGAPAFGDPQRLPTDVGCTDWRTVQEVPQGLLFQSARGFYLLPRGFGPPVFVGGAVQNSLATSYADCYGVGRTAKPSGQGESTVTFLMGTGGGGDAGFVWDCSLGRWVSVDTYDTEYTAAGSFGYGFAVCPSDMSSIRYQAGSSAWRDNTAAFECHLRTGAIHPFNFGGHGRVRKITFMGEYRGAGSLNARVTLDGKTQHTLAATAIGQVNGVALSQGNKWWFEWELPSPQHCSNIDIEVWDSATTTSEGLAFNGLVLHVIPDTASKRLGAGQRA
jgi:hypothetical protein